MTDASPQPRPPRAAPSHSAAQPRFKLLRYFVTASLLTLAVVTAAVGWFFTSAARVEFVRQGQTFAESVVAHLHTRVQEDFIIPTLARDGSVDLDDPEHHAALDRVVRASVAELGVDRIYFFDLAGQITYSTIAEHRGFSIRVNPFFDAAAAGEAASHVITRESPLDIGGSSETPLLESYVPVYDAHGTQAGVIEIYQDASGLVGEIRDATLQVAVVSFGSMLATLAVLLIVFVRGDQLIRTQTRELLTSNSALADLTANLEAQVEERTAQLVARERLAALGTLASGIAHEVNNPLASIASASEGLIRACERSDDGRPDADLLADYLAIIQDEAFRAKEITTSLLQVARQERRPRDPERVRLADLLDQVAQLTGLRDDSAPLAIDLDGAEDAEVLGMPGELRQVLFNVTANAVDAVAATGGTIRWTARVEPTTGQRQGLWLVLTCDDQGEGVAIEDCERVFEPFVTMKGPGKGTGLGLAISRSIVEAHAGRMRLGPRPLGAGTRVEIELPLIAKER